MKILKILLSIFFTFLLSSCSNNTADNGCPNEIVDWVDMVMIQDIKFQHHFPEPSDETSDITIEKGRELGKVTYKMADDACSDYQMKNGDAAFLEKGTSIYEMKGYPSSFAVIAHDKVYIVDTNTKAKTAGELYPLANRVKNIYIETTEDGRRLHAFSKSSKADFLEIWAGLKIKDKASLFQDREQDESRVFLEIELENGAAFREVYWPESNNFSSGIVGNEQMKVIIANEIEGLNNNDD